VAAGFANNKLRWLWVPAFAGTTQEWRVRQSELLLIQMSNSSSTYFKTVIASAAKQSSFLFASPWIASRSSSSGAHSRYPLARNDGGYTFAISPLVSREV
jgi:hypothetical protein